MEQEQVIEENKGWTRHNIAWRWPVSTIGLTLFITYYINVGANKFITYLMNGKKIMHIKLNYTLGLLGMLLVIPAAFISFEIIKILLRNQPLPETNEKGEHAPFIWYSYYGMILGILLYVFAIGILLRLLRISTPNLVGDPYAFKSLVFLVVIIGGPFLIYFGMKKVNQFMIEKTQTNQQLLEEIYRGDYASEFADLSQDEELEVVQAIQKGKATSVKSALFYSKAVRLFKLIGNKLYKFTAGFMMVIFLIWSVLADLFSGGSKSKSSSRQSSTPRPQPRRVTNMMDKRQAKKDAHWAAYQKNKEANHAWQYAKKQYDHNPNTHHMTSRHNRAVRMREEADKAERNHRNM